MSTHSPASASRAASFYTQMMPRILWLEEIGPDQRPLVGGKAASLAALLAAGFRVPPAFVITTEASLLFERPERRWPIEVETEILAAFDRLSGGEAVAVRSSAVDEDGEAASFAGQHATILDVCGREAFLDAVEHCLASLHAEHASAYRERAGGDSDEARMAVVVQTMVRSVIAGVAFSVDPARGDRDRVVVEAVKGTGEALVSGEAEGDRIVLARDDLRVVEEHHPGDPALTVELATLVARAALHAEAAFGAPQDVEFAYDGETLWLLQSRPITTLDAAQGWVNEFDSVTGPDDLWTSANVQEVLPGLLTPMTMSSFSANAHNAYAVGYQQLKLLRKDEWPAFVGLFYNRAYLNVGTTRLIAERSFGSSGDAVEHRYLGGEYRAKSRKGNSLELWRWRVRSLPPLLKMLVTLRKDARRIESDTMAMEQRVRAEQPARMTSAEIEKRRSQIADFATGVMATHLRVSGAAGASFDGVSRLVQPILKDETEGALPALFSGMHGVESAQIGIDIWTLSRVAIAEGLDASIRQGEFDPLSPDLPVAWRRAFAAFLQRHGHRGLNEMETAVKNWRADRAPVVSAVRAYLDLPADHSPGATLDRQERERLRLTAELAGRMNPVKRAVFGWSLREAQRWVATRERTKSVVVRAMRLIDYYIPELEGRLVTQSAIAEPEDLFFITTEELTEALLRESGVDYRAKVARRRREFERNRHVLLPERFHGHPSPIEPDLAHHAGDVLTGTPVSPGIATGRARVILDPSTDGPIQPGEVLIAPVTDAGWTPLFALASGLVVDMGSALSHGSTVAREYGLPAVANVRGATRTIRTGDLVLVNGSKGTVTVLEEAPT